MNPGELEQLQCCLLGAELMLQQEGGATALPQKPAQAGGSMQGAGCAGSLLCLRAAGTAGAAEQAFVWSFDLQRNEGNSSCQSGRSKL